MKLYLPWCINLFVFTYFAIKNSKQRNWTYIQKTDRFTKKTNAFECRNTKVSQLGLKPETTTESNIEFGGGDFSGGSEELCKIINRKPNK
jgi:hypothetical protein